jgi:hypothetical protein
VLRITTYGPTGIGVNVIEVASSPATTDETQAAEADRPPVPVRQPFPILPRIELPLLGEVYLYSPFTKNTAVLVQELPAHEDRRNSLCGAHRPPDRVGPRQTADRDADA